MISEISVLSISIVQCIIHVWKPTVIEITCLIFKLLWYDFQKCNLKLTPHFCNSLYFSIQNGNVNTNTLRDWVDAMFFLDHCKLAFSGNPQSCVCGQKKIILLFKVSIINIRKRCKHAGFNFYHKPLNGRLLKQQNSQE